MAPRETENNAYAKFWSDKQRTLWYVMVFLEWSIEYTSHLKTWDHPPPRRDDRARGAGRGAFIVLFL